MNTPKQILKKTLATVFFCGCASFVLGGMLLRFSLQTLP